MRLVGPERARLGAAICFIIGNRDNQEPHESLPPETLRLGWGDAGIMPARMRQFGEAHVRTQH